MSDQPSQPWYQRHLWQITPLQDLFWISLAALLLYCGYILRGVFVPILIGLFAAYLVNPLLNWVEERWQWKRSVLIAIALLLLATGIVVSGIVTIPRLVVEADRLADRAPGYVKTLANRLERSVDDEWIDAAQEAAESLPRNAGQLLQQVMSNTRSAFGVVADMLGSVFYVISMLVLTPVYFCFFAWNFNSMKQTTKQQIPSAQRPDILRVLRRMDHAVGEFIRGRILVTALMMVMFSVAFWAADVPYFLLLGLLTGLLSFIPYLAVLGCVLAVLVNWIDASQEAVDETFLQIVAAPVIAYSVVQLIEGWLITPWIQSKSTKMHAVTIVVVLLIGGTVAGVYGLLLAIPLTACMRILWEEFLETRLENWAADAAHSKSEDIQISVRND